MVSGEPAKKDPLRSAEYLAKILNVHPKTVARWVADGTIDSDEDYIKSNQGGEQIIALFREETVRRLEILLKEDAELTPEEREEVALQQENTGSLENRMAFIKWRVLAAKYRRLHEEATQLQIEMERAS